MPPEGYYERRRKKYAEIIKDVENYAEIIKNIEKVQLSNLNDLLEENNIKTI